MKKMMAAYWHKDGLDIYSFQDEQPVKYASGTLDSLQAIKRGLGTKVLIVGRERLMHLRKRYPPAPKDKLAKAVSLEIGEIFPLAKPDFYCRIFRTISNYTELDIWAWESDSYGRLKEIFPFSHVIPEDLLFTADEPEVLIFQHHGLIHMLAQSKGRLIDSVTIPLTGFDDEQVGRFLFNLSQVGEEIKIIRSYGLPQFRIKDILGVELIRDQEKHYLPCLEGIARVDLKEFRVRGEYNFIPAPGLVLRIFLYLCLGYGLMLFLTMRNFDRASADIRQRIAAMDKKVIALDASQSAVDYSDVVREVDTKLQNGLAPLRVINMLAQRLPEGSFVNRIMLTDNNLELLVSAKDPLRLVKSLGSDGIVKKVMLKGAPARDKGTGFYNFVVTLELIK